MAGVAAMLAALLGGLPSRAAPGPDSSGSADVPLGPPTAITLVTGEVLQVSEAAGDRLAVAYESGADPTAFARFTDPAGDTHLVPARLLPLLPDRLDPRLFNLSALLRDGYGARADGSGRGLPLVVTYTGEPVEVPGLIVHRQLPSIHAAAASLDGSGAAVLGTALASARPDRFIPGVAKIWLDGKVEASLDESVLQIGAPAAWAEGYDGSGVTIAVVDTGIDDSHPDLAGRVVAEKVFSDADKPTDVLGHGTHVASIAAGSGEASDGQYTGVAYGADLVNAKVLDDFGGGLESWVIAGMEWSAIEQDADVVNMSLGGGPSDGTDLVSQAVNVLSVEENALFVAAAGNFGGFPESIETPATAEAALAVGAVDKSDVLAYFSAWGPPLDGTAVKPEIVAPGVEITAARAKGAEIGLPVGEDYMELTGTSMAAPHVAGAAALLLDAHPGWTWDQLKSTLVTSAVDVGVSVFQQGGGRVDVPGALAQTVHSDLATIDLGALEFPHDDGETSTVDVSLTNAGDTEVVLDLAAAATNADGEPAPPTMLTLGTAQLVLGPGDAKSVPVTFDAATGPIGLFGGELTATAGGVEALHVPLAFEKEPQLVDLEVEVIERPGVDDLFGVVNIQNVDDIATYFEQFEVFLGDQTFTARVPLGTYSVSLLSAEFVGTTGMNLVAVAEPEIEITAARRVVLDSRKTSQIQVDVDADAAVLDSTISIHRASVVGEFGSEVSFGAAGFDPLRAFASPTEPISEGTFEFFSKWTLSDGADHWYDLIFPEPDAIPESLSYEVGPDDVAMIENAFHADVERAYLDGRFYFRPYSFGSFIVLNPVPVPLLRHDWVTADDTVWGEIIDIGGFDSSAIMEEQFTTYTPGEQRVQSWVESPRRPAMSGSFRDGDTIFFYVPPWTDQDNHIGHDAYVFEGDAYDQFQLTLSANGEVIGETDTVYGEFPVAPEETEYEVTLDASRTVDWWQHSTQTTTTWRFTSETPELGGEPIQLAQVNYGIELSLRNRTDAPNPITFQTVGIPGAPAITGLDASWSIDDGDTWDPLTLTDLGGGSYEAMVPVPASCHPSCFVSLQIVADGSDGPVLEQQVIRAYTARYVAASPTPTTPSPTPTSPEPTTPEPTTPEPTASPTTTLPGTGAGNAGPLAGLGFGVLLVGGLAVVLARRRLTKDD